MLNSDLRYIKINYVLCINVLYYKNSQFITKSIFIYLALEKICINIEFTIYN